MSLYTIRSMGGRRMPPNKDHVYRTPFTTAATEMLRLLLITSDSLYVKTNAFAELKRRGEI